MQTKEMYAKGSRKQIMTTVGMEIDKSAENKFDIVIKELEAAKKQAVTEVTFGPLNINPNTKKLQEILEKLLDGKQFKIEKDGNDELLIQFEGDEKKINLSLIIKGDDQSGPADLNHITLNDEYQKKYVDFIRDKSPWKPYFPNLKSQDEEAHVREIKDKNPGLQDLSYPEVIAINIYTQPYYKDMNELMRKRTCDANEPEEFKAKLLTIALASQGLNRIKNEEIDSSYRVEVLTDTPEHEAILQNRMRVATARGVTTESGFISSSTDKVTDEETLEIADTAIMFHDMYGKNITALSSLQGAQGEKEFLIPPTTQVQWEGYKEEGGKHYFVARNVSTPKIIEDTSYSSKFDEVIKIVKEIEERCKSQPELARQLNSGGYLDQMISIVEDKTQTIDVMLKKISEIKKIVEQITNGKEINAVSSSHQDWQKHHMDDTEKKPTDRENIPSIQNRS